MNLPTSRPLKSDPVAVQGTRPCPGCGVTPGTQHDGCDVARCRVTGTQFIQCGFDLFSDSDSDGQEGCGPDCAPDIWTGLWPGVAEARERGWYSVILSGSGWVSVSSNHPGASEDLNRVMGELVWDPATQRRVDPGPDLPHLTSRSMLGQVKPGLFDGWE